MQSLASAYTVVFSDKQLPCRDCGASFVFSAAEQEFFAAKALQNEPKRCTACRLKQRAVRTGKDIQVTEVPCADCGTLTNVPFQPKGYRPVYCSHCYHAKKRQNESGSS